MLASDGVGLTPKQEAWLKVIDRIYEQQQYMYEKQHAFRSGAHRQHQPAVHQADCQGGGAAAPVEFGAKLDLSIDENGMARLERLSFDAYNESDVLIGAIERYRDRTSHYPQRVLADKIYRNRENLAFCKQRGIRLSDSPLGGPKKNAIIDKRTEYADNADRVEVERAFSFAKRCYGLGRIMTKLDATTRSSIALSVLAMNVDRLASLSLFRFLISLFSRYRQHEFMLINMQNNLCEISVGY